MLWPQQIFRNRFPWGNSAQVRLFSGELPRRKSPQKNLKCWSHSKNAKIFSETMLLGPLIGLKVAWVGLLWRKSLINTKKDVRESKSDILFSPSNPVKWRWFSMDSIPESSGSRNRRLTKVCESIPWIRDTLVASPFISDCQLHLSITQIFFRVMKFVKELKELKFMELQ